MNKKIVLIGLVAALVLAGGVLALVQYNIERQVEERVAAFVAELPAEVNVDYRAVDVGFLGRDVRIEDIAVQVVGQAPVTIERIHVRALDRHNEPPHFLHAQAEGLTQDVAEVDREEAEMLQQLGYSELRGNYEIDYHYEAGTREFDLRRLRATIVDMGAIELQLQLSDFDFGQLETDGQELPNFSLRGLVLSYQDHSLTPRILRETALEHGATEEELVDDLLLQLRMQLAGLDAPFLERAHQEIERFLRDPNELHLRAQPDEPVTLARFLAVGMTRPMDLPDVLGLEIEAR